MPPILLSTYRHTFQKYIKITLCITVYITDHPLLMQTLLDSMTGRTKTWTDTHIDLYVKKMYSGESVHKYVRDFTRVVVGGHGTIFPVIN